MHSEDLLAAPLPNGKNAKEMRKEVTKEGPKMDYSVVPFPKPTKKKKKR